MIFNTKLTFSSSFVFMLGMAMSSAALAENAVPTATIKPYAAVRGGVAVGGMQVKVGVDDVNETFSDTGFTGSLAVGVRLTPVVRAELEYTYASEMSDDLYGYTNGIEDVKIVGKFQNNTVLANLYFDIPIPDQPIVPFFGIGFGATIVKSKADVVGLTSGNRESGTDRETAFTAGATLGIGIPVSKQVTFDAALRYTYTAYEEGLNTFGGTIGLRYGF